MLRVFASVPASSLGPRGSYLHSGAGPPHRALRIPPEQTLACRPGSLGATALHTAVWTNHVEMVAELLSAGASPDVRDVESGWTALHKALHLGYLRVATILLEFGASLHVEDTEGRMPADLLSLDACQGAGASGGGGVLSEGKGWLA